MFIMSFFFFFSSRRRHTRYWRDWSSDVCSSDLLLVANWAPHPTEGDKLLFVFDGGILLAGERAQIVLDGVEVDQFAFHQADQIDALLIPRQARRVHAAIGARARSETAYLESGTAFGVKS